MFLLNGKNNNLHASGNSVKEERGMLWNNVLETEVGCRARGAGSVGRHGQVAGVLTRACGSSPLIISVLLVKKGVAESKEAMGI